MSANTHERTSAGTDGGPEVRAAAGGSDHEEGYVVNPGGGDWDELAAEANEHSDERIVGDHPVADLNQGFTQCRMQAGIVGHQQGGPRIGPGGRLKASGLGIGLSQDTPHLGIVGGFLNARLQGRDHPAQ